MFITGNYEQAKQKAQRTSKPIWKHADGTYAVAYASEFPEDEAMDWTQVQAA
jgi:endonuclease YncB( thermonuclease family)